MPAKLHILGSAAATPRSFTNPTSQVLEMAAGLYLIDCGEGTQIALRKSKVRFSAIGHIFISHLHGDHFFGLIGLLSSFNLLGRKKAMHLFGPEGLEEIINLQFKLTRSKMNYPLVFHSNGAKEIQTIWEDDKIEVRNIPLRHSIGTNGFLFREKPHQKKLNAQAAQEFGVPVCDFTNLKNGKDFIRENGEVIPNGLLTFDAPPSLSYAFCTDTAYKPDITSLIHGVNVLYHESTFLEKDSKMATMTLHSTAREAAMIARDAEVKKLLLGHFSTRYDDIKLFEREARIVFENSTAVSDGDVYDIG